jgi:hypothetical protein
VGSQVMFLPQYRPDGLAVPVAGFNDHETT